MTQKRCHSCGSDKLTPYHYKPPRADRKGRHECDETCIAEGTVCLNRRLVDDRKRDDT